MPGLNDVDREQRRENGRDALEQPEGAIWETSP